MWWSEGGGALWCNMYRVLFYSRASSHYLDLASHAGSWSCLAKAPCLIVIAEVVTACVFDCR